MISDLLNKLRLTIIKMYTYIDRKYHRLKVIYICSLNIESFFLSDYGWHSFFSLHNNAISFAI